jgi:beta-glucosidase-like glycosyl hydrolase
MNKKNIRVIILAMAIFAAFFSGKKQERPERDNVERIIAKMSLREKVGQLFIIEYSDKYDLEDPYFDKLIKKDKIGGLILMEMDLDNYIERINRFQKMSKIPLFISVDGEWGASMRFDTLTQFPRNMQMGALTSPDLVYQVGRAMSKQFVRLGIHINYAPTIDINNNPLNPVIGQRSFGDDREKVAIYGAAIIKGLQDGGTLTSAKHFPGHGDTEIDSHKSLPVLSFNRARLDSLELYPFKHVIKEGVAMVMVGHLSVPSLDSSGVPSSISYSIITKLLKEELGFEGIVVTDALGMKGVAEYIPRDRVAIESFKAGSDILLMPPAERRKSISTFLKAVRRGEIPKERVEESLRKILKMKEQAGLLGSTPQIDPVDAFAQLETREVLDIINKVAEESMTLIKPPDWGPDQNLETLSAIGAADTIILPRRITKEILENARKRAEGVEFAVIYLPEMKAPKNDRENYAAIPPQEIYNFISAWAREQKIVLAIMDNPYALDKIDIEAFEGILVGYSSSKANLSAADKVFRGKLEAHGVLPAAAGGFPSGYHANLNNK